MMKKIVLLSMLLFQVLMVLAQEKSNECILFLKEAFTALNNHSSLENKACFFDYTVRTVPSNTEISSAVAHVQAYMTQGYSIITGDQMEVYKDPQNTFTVIPMRKSIYWSSTLRDDSSVYSGTFGDVREKFFDESIVKECKEISGNNFYNLEIFLLAKDKSGFGGKIKGVRFWVNTQKKIIYKIMISYTTAFELTSMEVTFHQVDLEYSRSKVVHVAESKIFKNDGNLLSKYQGYKVRDVRKK